MTRISGCGSSRITVVAVWLAVLGALAVARPVVAQDQDKTWAFAPARDGFAADALLDLRSLNEDVAGAKGWLKVDAQGEFVRGDGGPIRLWAINDSCAREQPFQARPLWEKTPPDLAHHARWLAKRGVNMVRLHLHLNPTPGRNSGAKLTDVDMPELECIWRAIAAYKKEGIYVTVSPFWSAAMKSDDARWGTDWGGNHFGLLFFDETLQKAYYQWLRVLFTTPTPLLGGKTLAQEPALGIFQIQNEDSLLFWTINNLKGAPRDRLGRKFADFAIAKYGSLDAAATAWKSEKWPGDKPEDKVLGFQNMWRMTAPAAKMGQGPTPRCYDQVEFFARQMHDFNQAVAKVIHQELKCPVLINAGNWRTADTLLLNDAERWSYTANEVLAVNRYYGGMHLGPNRGWAIQKGDQYTSDSVLTNDPMGFPLNLKLVVGKPMLVTESSWVFPCETGAESPLLISAYSSLNGCAAYYWFANDTEEWTPPRSANGYMASQGKWICATPDVLGQFPGAALAYRKGYIKRGEPAVSEHRALAGMWKLETPVIAEESGFDPNRDKGDLAAKTGPGAKADPYAFFVGPVVAKYDSDPAQTRVADLKRYIQDVPGGRIVRSNTSQIELNTAKGYCQVDTPKVQAVTAHFARQQDFKLTDVTVHCGNPYGAVMVVSLDDKPIAQSGKLLVQVGLPCRPTNWKTQPTQIKPKDAPSVEGKEVLDYGKAPWQVVKPDLQITIRRAALREAVVLDANGQAVKTLPLENADGGKRLTFPEGALYVVLR